MGTYLSCWANIMKNANSTFSYFLAFVANYTLSRKYAQHFRAWRWQTKVWRFVLIPTNGSMFTFSISSVYSMLRNDIVKFLIMIVNRQIISWSINHYWNRLSVVSNIFSPEYEIHMSSAQFSIFVTEKFKNFKPKPASPSHISWIFVSILWMRRKISFSLEFQVTWQKNFKKTFIDKVEASVNHKITGMRCYPDILEIHLVYASYHFNCFHISFHQLLFMILFSRDRCKNDHQPNNESMKSQMPIRRVNTFGKNIEKILNKLPKSDDDLT